jgi:hypothetical protein
MKVQSWGGGGNTAAAAAAADSVTVQYKCVSVVLWTAMAAALLQVVSFACQQCLKRSGTAAHATSIHRNTVRNAYYLQRCSHLAVQHEQHAAVAPL